MKYILGLILATLVFLVAFTVAFVIGLWKFKFTMLKEAWEEYKEIYSSFLWAAFRIRV